MSRAHSVGSIHIHLMRSFNNSDYGGGGHCENIMGWSLLLLQEDTRGTKI